jgi:hypothetical protein
MDGEGFESNKRKGKAGENRIKMRLSVQGAYVERTGRGSDYRVTEKNWNTGERETYLAEVKSGDYSKLSALQRKTQKKNKNYRVIRTDPWDY